MRDVAIIGVGQTKVGEHWETSLRHLALQAIQAAMADAGVRRVDAVYVGNALSGELVDQQLSAELKALFVDYQASLGLQGRGGFGTLSADNYDEYLLRHYLVPSASDYLSGLDASDRDAYLAQNTWIEWDGQRAHFAFADYQLHGGRFKLIPAFDDFQMKLAEPSLFGDEKTEARHFTEFTLRKTTGDHKAEVDPEVRALTQLMNPMYFTMRDNPGCAEHWWLRRGTGESGISMTAMVNLAVSLENHGKQVDSWMFWDAMHCIDEDPEGFIAWIGEITGR